MIFILIFIIIWIATYFYNNIYHVDIVAYNYLFILLHRF